MISRRDLAGRMTINGAGIVKHANVVFANLTGCERINIMERGNTTDYASGENSLGKISSDVRFYTVDEIAGMTGWSRKVVLRLFHDPQFPSSDFGRAMIVEAHALIEYFSKKHRRDDESYWTKGELRDELRKRVR